MKNLILTAGLALITSMAAHSATTWKKSPYIDIKHLYPHDSGLIVLVDYKDENVSSCDNGSRFSISITDKNYSLKASALVAAFSSNKKVSLIYDPQQSKQCDANINRFIVKY
ncbi:hypothetical protein [Vibrio splendidus]|uniref:hypothetical protein n=1 Tax=Vibrio splendidus TaxID=29497 RepID=UPI00076ADE8F|nr:hypothetical protein [Vibrio splendidus]